MNSRNVKIFTILVLVVLVIVTFYATSKQKERQQNGIETVVENKEKEISNEKDNITNEENKITNIEEKENNIETQEEVITISEDESTEILQYRIPDCYVLGEETSYALGGYKYFIIKSQSEFKNYIATRFVSSENDEPKPFNTEEVEEKVNSEFFKNGSVVILVYYNQNKKIDGKINNVEIMQDELNINIEKNNDSKNATNFITYIIPVETKGFKTIKVKY